MRILLICHHDSLLHREGVARWVASFATVAGILVVHERRSTLLRRARRELQRCGALGFADVLAFRVYYRAALARRDRTWRSQRLCALQARFAEVPASTPVLEVGSPNSEAARAFIQDCCPDLSIALCKNLLAERIFSIPPLGTFVLHPGICPEYRNAHGCFWALSQRDLSNVGLTLLRIDRGVDTGPVLGYFRSAFDERHESHCVIQDRMLLDNLDAVRDRLVAIGAGTAKVVPVAGRKSAIWGQPRLTSYFRWKRAARATSPRGMSDRVAKRCT